MKTQFKFIKKGIILFGILLVASSITGCKKESGKFTVLLTDSPGSYQEVNVEILQVAVHINADRNSKAGWYDLHTNAGIYDLLTLHGTSIPLASNENLPVGDITEMRLILGTNNSVMDANGQVFAMTVPSGSESGIKIVGLKLKKNDDAQVVLDFDADLSVEYNGKDYKLKPVIKVK